MIPEELSADLALKNGKIVTIDQEDAVAQAVTVKGNRIVVVGGDEDVSGSSERRRRSSISGGEP